MPKCLRSPVVLVFGVAVVAVAFLSSNWFGVEDEEAIRKVGVAVRPRLEKRIDCRSSKATKPRERLRCTNRC